MENGEQRDYSISELADEAGVSTRTIRYYVSEGLLPPPVGVGPNSRYTDAHLQQLTIIGRLKEQYLPLKEIRRRLIGHNLPDAPHSREADANRSQPAPSSPPAQYRKVEREPVPESTNQAKPRRLMRASEDLTNSYLIDNVGSRPLESELLLGAPKAMPPGLDPGGPGINWRRIPISSDAELVITEDQYTRHQDKIDWLVQWASRVLE